MKKRIKFFLVVILALGILILLLIHLRTPFFQRDAGGWSLGYGESKEYPKTINVKGNAIYSIEKLKIQVNVRTKYIHKLLNLLYFILKLEQLPTSASS